MKNVFSYYYSYFNSHTVYLIVLDKNCIVQWMQFKFKKKLKYKII